MNCPHCGGRVDAAGRGGSFERAYLDRVKLEGRRIDPFEWLDARRADRGLLPLAVSVERRRTLRV